jgi:hypothetical protein
LIIVQAMSSDGWLPKAKLVFQAKKRTGDYHGQMDSANGCDPYMIELSGDWETILVELVPKLVPPGGG